MNWLAHLRLAPVAPLLQLGNLAGDFVRGVDLGTLHPDLQRGVLQHRAIDRFVDAHAQVRQSRLRLEPPFRRFAGVLVDVYYDHFLARDWHRYGDGGTLAGFASGVHASLRQHAELLPPDLRRVAPRLEQQGWLAGYATIDGIDVVLTAMARRIARPTPLAQGAAELRRQYATFADDFQRFWPLLEGFARGLDEA